MYACLYRVGEKNLANTKIEVGGRRRLTAAVREAGHQGETDVMDVREGKGFEKENVKLEDG